MLDEILESRPETNVLSFLLVAPARSFSELELSRRLAMKSLTLLPALDYLVKQGQLKQFKKNGKSYFLLNQKYRMFPEIRRMLTAGKKPYEDELFLAIRKLGAIKGAFLSGIFTGHPELPVDVLIIGKVSDQKITEFIRNCERMMEQEINYSVMSVEEYKERRHTFDRFIKDIFDYPHLVVVDTIGK